MKARAIATCAVATVALAAVSNTARAQSNEEILRRLDALTKENAALRERVKRIEQGSRQAPAAPVRVASLGTTSDASQVGPGNEARAAHAAGMPVKGVSYVRPSCAQFGGFYAGGNVGWGVYGNTFSDRDGLGKTIDDGLPTTIDARKSGFVGGALGGYNWQRGCTVVGIETDWSWSGLKTSEFQLDGDQVAGGITDSMTAENKLKWFGTTRARAGVVVDNLLLYATAGLAYARFSRAYTFFQDGPVQTARFSSDSTRLGWTAGAGAEWAFATNWTLRGEFLYAAFEPDRLMASGNGTGIGATGVSYRLDTQDTLWVSRMGLSYRFGGLAQ